MGGRSFVSSEAKSERRAAPTWGRHLACQTDGRQDACPTFLARRLAALTFSNRDVPDDLCQLPLQTNTARVEVERRCQKRQNEAVRNKVCPAIDADSGGN